MTKLFSIIIPAKSFKYTTTFDIDIAYNYQYKPLWKNTLGAIKDLAKGKWKLVSLRLAVLQGKQQDPYDNFEWMREMHQKHDVEPIYFWLLAAKNSTFDTNNLPHSSCMKSLMQANLEHAVYGIHPSYSSHLIGQNLGQEIEYLQAYAEVDKSRQHFIKFSLPETYRNLIAANIKEDYSMGYPDANGFRAGTSNAFPWFDLLANQSTDLLIHPFVYMDATSIFYNKHSTEKAFAEIERLFWIIKKTNSQMITIFHNYTLGNNGTYKGWNTVYERTLDLVTT